ncbi:hypothetical protein ACTHAM_000100 [Cellulomonas soli]|uniref:hypothetical protein n=1 Tax=Cellulomonas soli TaxID=931535 RepID=UPI003F858554
MSSGPAPEGHVPPTPHASWPGDTAGGAPGRPLDAVGAAPGDPLDAVVDPTLEELPGTPVPGASPEALPRHRRRTGVVVLAVALVLVVAVAGLLVARMVRTTQAWESTAAQWEALAREHGEDLAVTRVDLDTALAELDSTSAQLATAQARITELADEKAQLGDATESQRQLADYQARVSAAAGTVATALTSCVDGQQRLIEYLKDSAAYDAADLARFEQDVERVCDAATAANTALQQELDR